MAKDWFLHSLFDAHMQDLQEVQPGLREVVACPICLGIFSREAIARKQLTDGHVWPKDFRQDSPKVSQMRVILCKNCNNTAGSKGDKQMQLMELIKKGEETGELYGKRIVEIRKKTKEPPVKLPVTIFRNINDNSISITGSVDENINLPKISHKDQIRFKEIIESKLPVSITINPNQELRPGIVPAGWITSAYLMAFYGLGYRYILHESLNPVRQYIKQSLDQLSSKSLSLPKDENFTIREYKDKFFPEPELLFIYPLENGKRVYLQINFLKYEIRLPFRFVKKVFDGQISETISKSGIKFPVPLPGDILYFPILCTKMKNHECWYDFLLGKTLPESPK